MRVPESRGAIHRSGLGFAAVWWLVFLGPLPRGAVLYAQEAVAAARSVRVTAAVPVESFRLDNGLTVVLSEDHSAPVTAVSVWYHVGAAHEFEGHTGLSHLVEHLLGSRVRGLGGARLERLVRDAGGVTSTSTDVDRTAFEMVVPSGALELALWIQSGRLDDARFGDSLLFAATAAVEAEARLQIDAQPYARSQIVVDTLISAYAPYRNPLVGGPDLGAIDAGVVRRFHALHYVPANAVLTIVETPPGNGSRHWHGGTSGRSTIGLLRLGCLPFQRYRPAGKRGGPRWRIRWRPHPYSGSPLPCRRPSTRTCTRCPSCLPSSARGGAAVSRSVLVRRTQVAREVVSVLNRRRGPGSLLLGALPTDGTESERLERVLLSVIDTLRAGGVTQEELEKAKNQRRATEVAARLTLAGRASELQRHQLYGGRAARANDELERYDAVVPEDLLRVARRYLIAENRAVVLVLPGGPRWVGARGGGSVRQGGAEGP